MNRKEYILQGLDIRQSVGLEIGALANPIVTKADGTIFYVDYADTEFLRTRYHNDPIIDVTKIVTIDAIWGNKTLAEAIGGIQVDYIIASHVIEHVPDLVTWLGELHSVLHAGGQVRLVIPDKRYSFDYLRAETRISDILNAYLVRARIPLPHEILDFCLNKTEIDTAAAWRNEIDPNKLKKDFTFEGAMWLAQDSIRNGTYHDVHCWAFTPRSFASLGHELAKANLLKFACHDFINTAHNELEFYVTLKASNDQDEIIESWTKMIEETHADKIAHEVFSKPDQRETRTVPILANPAEPSLQETMVPLCVDLDGTLIHSDLLVESALALFARNPLMLFAMLAWLLRGKAYLKQEIARRVDLNPSALPYNSNVVEWLRDQRKFRPVVLCTAADTQLASKVATHVGGFDTLLASDGTQNLSGSKKAQILVNRYGERGFDYAGNASADLKVWEHARAAIVVESGSRLSAAAAQVTRIERTFSIPRPSLHLWLKALRVHQWIKNVLVFLPLLTSHRVFDLQADIHAALAFLCFGLCASSVYLTNDLLDLPSDRQHHRKRHRPFAAGRLPLVAGPPAALGLLITAFALAVLLLPWTFTMVLVGYYALTTAYSFRLKRIVMLDVVVLALLYTTRILAGTNAISAPASFWLLAFSMFIFLSLAMIKRYTELLGAQKTGKAKASGRGYDVEDIPLIQSLGGSSGYLAVLVLALYVDSTASNALYRHPHYLWLLCPLLLYWISRTWAIAHRGIMHDDPVVFAIMDRTSRWLLVIAAAIVTAAV